MQEKTGKSPLQLLAQTCSQIGADPGSNKLLAEKSGNGTANLNSKDSLSSNRGSTSPSTKTGHTNNTSATGNSAHGGSSSFKTKGNHSPALIVSEQPANATINILRMTCTAKMKEHILLKKSINIHIWSIVGLRILWCSVSHVHGIFVCYVKYGSSLKMIFDADFQCRLNYLHNCSSEIFQFFLKPLSARTHRYICFHFSYGFSIVMAVSNFFKLFIWGWTNNSFVFFKCT